MELKPFTKHEKNLILRSYDLIYNEYNINSNYFKLVFFDFYFAAEI